MDLNPLSSKSIFQQRKKASNSVHKHGYGKILRFGPMNESVILSLRIQTKQLLSRYVSSLIIQFIFPPKLKCIILCTKTYKNKLRKILATG